MNKEIEKIDPGTSKDIYDRAYFLVRDTMRDGEPYSREEFLDAFIGGNADKLNNDEKDRMNLAKKAINARARKLGANWRIFYSRRYDGGAYLKLSKGSMVRTEAWQRVNYIASGLNMVHKNIRPMIAAEGIDPRDVRLIKEMTAVSKGAKLSIAGSISQMRSLSKDQKRLLIAKLDPVFDALDEFERAEMGGFGDFDDDDRDIFLDGAGSARLK